jgi:transcriptional regulator with XRE-family HTH domain
MLMTDHQAERSKYIGETLKSARIQQRISVSKCAALLGTTRRRYSDIESGRSKLSVVELELLCELLDLSPLAIFPQCKPQKVHRVVVCSGDMLEIRMEVDARKR